MNIKEKFTALIKEYGEEDEGIWYIDIFKILDDCEYYCVELDGDDINFYYDDDMFTTIEELDSDILSGLYCDLLNAFNGTDECVAGTEKIKTKKKLE